jgi:hypothetical protein
LGLTAAVVDTEREEVKLVCPVTGLLSKAATAPAGRPTAANVTVQSLLLPFRFAWTEP